MLLNKQIVLTDLGMLEESITDAQITDIPAHSPSNLYVTTVM
jgi:hypothetical protein